MKHCLTAILLGLAITGCNSPSENPVSEQPQATEGTPEPALVQTSEPSPKQTPVQQKKPSPKQTQCKVRVRQHPLVIVTHHTLMFALLQRHRILIAKMSFPCDRILAALGVGKQSPIPLGRISQKADGLT
jgi:PBP1b-binding outer membrane lipoprotein LpoB